MIRPGITSSWPKQYALPRTLDLPAITSQVESGTAPGQIQCELKQWLSQYAWRFPIKLTRQWSDTHHNRQCDRWFFQYDKCIRLKTALGSLGRRVRYHATWPRVSFDRDGNAIGHKNGRLILRTIGGDLECLAYKLGVTHDRETLTEDSEGRWRNARSNLTQLLSVL